ncbi:hypothetical protein G9A89_007089 [Geosiphon pyriformis]|nr:hypothetical protein G9A89_007089 [Geosiphon pyriformis]
MPLFSGATLEEKPITTMYTDVKIDGHYIKLILDIDRATSARIITANEVTKTPISKINDLPIEINGIIVPIKILVIEATQYQALNTQELQLSQNGQHTQVPATYGHFKTTNTMHNKLSPILFWDDNGKGKQTNKLTWKTNDLTWTNNKQEKPSSWEWKEEKGKGKEREEENIQANNTYIPYTYSQQQSSTYR